jgi:hypothetical protein
MVFLRPVMMSLLAGAALSAAVSTSLAAAQDAQRDVPPAVQVQEALAGIDVVVTDPSGAVVQNARVTVVDASGTKTEGFTNESGHLSLSHLPLGLYTVTVRSSGFMSEQTTIKVPQGEIAKIALSPSAQVSHCSPCVMTVEPFTIIASTTSDFLPDPTANVPPTTPRRQNPTPQRNPLKSFFSSLGRKLGL